LSGSFAKVLTKNDTGETGGHQAGIAVPKANTELLSFFPFLNPREFNPDSWLYCTDIDGQEWEMRYIYYNGKTFNPPKSTRNEYRITHMTKFLTKWMAKTGDVVIFKKTSKENHFQISIRHESASNESLGTTEDNDLIVLRGWSRIY